MIDFFCIANTCIKVSDIYCISEMTAVDVEVLLECLAYAVVACEVVTDAGSADIYSITV